MNTTIEKVVYTAQTRTTGGRMGESKSSDGKLDIKLSSPGSSGPGTNPEQLFAAGWSACFIGAMGKVAAERNLKLPVDTSVETEVDLCLSDDGYFLRARLNISLPGIDKHVASEIATDAHKRCPYSKAIKNNVQVETRVS